MRYMWKNPGSLHFSNLRSVTIFSRFHIEKWILILSKLFWATDSLKKTTNHVDVIKWKHFPRYWPFVRGFHRSPVISPQKGQWRGALVFSSICVWIKGSENNREAGDLRRHRDHYDVTVMGFGRSSCHNSTEAAACTTNTFGCTVNETEGELTHSRNRKREIYTPQNPFGKQALSHM